MSVVRRSYTLIGATLAAAALTASVAIAATEQTYSQKFTVKKPGQSTGMTFKADQPTKTPTSAKRVTLTFPPGTKINPDALPKCSKPPKCPKASKVGTGTATVMLGAAALPLSSTAYNRKGGLVLVVDDPTDPTHPIVLKPAIRGEKLVLDVPPLKKGGLTLVLKGVTLATDQIGKGAKAYVRTPPVCAKGGAWTFKGKFEYVDGTSKELTSKSPCVKR